LPISSESLDQEYWLLFGTQQIAEISFDLGVQVLWICWIRCEGDPSD